MSQYYFANKSGRNVLYGLDKPTGGYFFTEFSTDAEIENENAEEVVQQKDGLTFSELCSSIETIFNHHISNGDLKNLVLDWKLEPNPTPLQYRFQKMFGIDLDEKLERCKQEFLNFPA